MHDNYIVKQLLPGIWRFTDKPEHPYVDIYLVEGKEKALLVDAGDSKTDLSNYLRQFTKKPIELLITHGHGDHTANMDQFDCVYMNHIDIEVLKTKFNQHVDESKIKDIKGGEILDFGDFKIEVIAVPGHTSGCMAFLDRERQFLFTGDSIGSGMLWMQLPGALPLEVYAKEVAKLEHIVCDMEKLKVFVGHSNQHEGELLSLQYIEDVRELAERIVSGETVGDVVTNPDIKFGGRIASNGLIKEFVYDPDNVSIK